MSEQNEQQPQGVPLDCFKVTSPHNPIFGDNQPTYLHVLGVGHNPLGKFERLEYLVFGADGTILVHKNADIEGADYDSMNHADPMYMYNYVAALLSLSFVPAQPE